MEILQREAIYLWYYFDVQLRQIFWYWVLGMTLGSAVSVFLKDHIHNTVRSLSQKKLGLTGIVFSSLLGIASPCACMELSPLQHLFPKAVCGMIGWLPS